MFGVIAPQEQGRPHALVPATDNEPTPSSIYLFINLALTKYMLVEIRQALIVTPVSRQYTKEHIPNLAILLILKDLHKI